MFSTYIRKIMHGVFRVFQSKGLCPKSIVFCHHMPICSRSEKKMIGVHKGALAGLSLGGESICDTYISCRWRPLRTISTWRKYSTSVIAAGWKVVKVGGRGVSGWPSTDSGNGMVKKYVLSRGKVSDFLGGVLS